MGIVLMWVEAKAKIGVCADKSGLESGKAYFLDYSLLHFLICFQTTLPNDVVLCEVKSKLYPRVEMHADTRDSMRFSYQ